MPNPYTAVLPLALVLAAAGLIALGAAAWALRTCLQQKHAEREERRRLEQLIEELQRSKEAFLRAFDEIAYRRQFPEQRIEWRGGVEKLLGYTPGEIASDGESGLRHIHAEDLPAVKREIERVRAERSLFQIEYRYQHANGSWRWIYDRGVPHFDEHGELTEINGTMRDVTAMHVMEEERGVIARRFSSVLDSMSDGFVVLGGDWRCLFVNRRACKLMRATERELIGQVLWERFPEAAGGEFRRACERARAEQRSAVVGGFYEPWTSWFECDVYPSGENLSLFFRDVTERKLAEQRLRESQERLELAIWAAEIGPWVWYPKTGKVWLSREWKQQLGYADHELPHSLGEWESRLHPDEHDAVLERVMAIGSGASKRTEEEFRLRHKDGSYRWFLSRARVVTDAHGHPEVLHGVNIDITERRVAELERRRVERRLEDIIASIPDALIELDRAWNFVFVSEAAARRIGVAATDLIGRNAWQFFPDVLALPWRDVADRVMRERRPEQLEQYYAPHGRWYHNHFYPTSEGIAVFIEDVSSAKALEAALSLERERYRATFEQAPVGVLHLTADGSLTRANPRMCEMLGYQATEILRLRLGDIAAPAGDRAERNRLEAVLQAERGQTQSRLQRKDGSSFWAEISVAQVQGEAASGAYFVAMVQDISARKLAEAQLEASRERLRAFTRQLTEAVENERARISREIHDELGQALTCLKLDIGWVRRRMADPKADNLAAMLERIQSMARFIDEILDSVRRLSTELRPALLDSLGLPAALEAQTRHIAARSDGEVELALQQGLTLSPDQATGLYRIAQEALTNIARHASARRIRVVLQASGAAVVMEIEDNGVGFDPDALSDDRLGLLGIDERARLLGGDAEISSEPGRGTRIRVTLPLADVPAEDEAAAAN